MTGDQQLDEFFDEAIDGYWETAGDRTTTRDYVVAGRPLRVHYATPRLHDSLHPSMVHLSTTTPPATAPFTVHAWGGDLPHGELPAPPWDAVSYFERGNIRGAHGHGHVLTYDRRPGLFSAADHTRQRGIYWAHESSKLPYYERAEPFRRLLPAWLQADGMFIAHAAAVGYPDGGALLAGRAGAGKSTTSVLCIGSSLGFAGDDFVLIEPGDEPRLHSLYSSAKLKRDVLDWRPDFRAEVVNEPNPGGEKALIHAGVSWPDRMTAGFPLRAILLPNPTSGRATITDRITSSEAFKGLVPDTLFRALGPPQLVTRGLSQLVRQLPCYRLSLGTDVAGVPAAIEALLSEYRPALVT